MIYGLLMIIIGTFMLMGSLTRSNFILYKLLVARSKILWGKNVYKFHAISAVLIILVGILML